MPRDHLDARFERLLRKQDKRKTGLKRTEEWYHICEKCHQVHKGGFDQPERCQGNDMVSGAPCLSVEFKSYNNLEIEAMPIGKVYIDMRRKGW